MSNRKVVGGSVLAAGLAAAAVAGSGVVGAEERTRAAQSPLRFTEIDVFAEINRTDGDAAFLMTVAAEDNWRRVSLRDPRGRRVLDLSSRGTLARQGLIGLELESGERAFDELPLSKFKARFPRGRYTFRGTTASGRRIVGSARLSHSFPGGARITAPAANSTVAPGPLVISWTRPSGPRVATYEIAIAADEAQDELTATIGGSRTSFTVPDGFLKAKEGYTLELIAVAASGNKGIREIAFKTG